jgi:hypothetical protein
MTNIFKKLNALNLSANNPRQNPINQNNLNKTDRKMLDMEPGV